MPEPAPTAILGGGALGLTLALRLAQQGHPVTLLEREPEPGGLASGFKPSPHLPNGGPYLDKFYHHIFKSDTHIISLLKELHLAADLHWSSPTNSVLLKAKFWQPYSPVGVLRFSLLPPQDRLRMAAALAALKLAPNPRPFERVTAHEWLPRYMGQTAYDLLWRPLLQAKFHSHYQHISMAWFWARIHDRSFQLGYLKGGFQRLYDALVSEIRRLGGQVLLGHEVLEAFHAPDQDPGRPWTVRWRRPNETLTHSASFARVASTLPTRLTLKLIPQLPDTFRQLYDWGDALGAHCLVLALDRPLLPDNVYWLNVNDPGHPFLVLVEHTNYIPAREYGGRHLVYLGNYLPMDHPLFRQSKAEVLQQFLPAVRRIVPSFQEESIVDSWTFAAPYAQPVVTLDFPNHIPPLRAPLPNLWLGSMFQVYPHDRGQNYSIELADRLAAEMATV